MAGFALKSIAELYRQLRLSPPDVRRRHVERIEKLLLELAPERTYPYEFIYFRATGFRPKENVLEAHPGAEVMPDLQLALLKLSGSVPQDVATQAETVYSVDRLAASLNVSSRTIHRWRRRGLVVRKYVFPDGRRRTGVRQTALDAFLEENQDAVARSGRFRRLSRAEEGRILDLARRHAKQEELARTEIIDRIATELGRAPETVRLALLRHDRDHPAEAVFGERAWRLPPRDRRKLWSEHQAGTPVEDLCARYGRSRSTIYRIINQEKAAELLQEAIEYRHESAFDAAGADADIAGADVRDLLRKLSGATTAGGSEEMASPDTMPWQRAPLAKADEAALFRAYNYARFRVSELRKELDPRGYVSSRLLKRIEAMRGLSQGIRDTLLAIHLPLVERVARQHARGPSHMQDLVTTGRGLLERLVETFDYRGRGRFSSHVTLELFKRFARTDAVDEAGRPGRRGT